MNSKYFLIFLVVSIIIYWIVNPFYISIEKKKESSIKVEEVIDSTFTVSFSAVGDIMCHSTQYNYAWVQKDSFDFNPVFSVIGDYLRDKDILIGNLETVLAGNTKNYRGYPFFNSPNQLVDALGNTGFDFLITANNHANDQGLEGIKRTLEVIESNEIIPIGTHYPHSNRQNQVFAKDGLKFSILAYTYGTNFHSGELKPQMYVNYIDTLMIKNDIQELKNEGSDLIIVYFHFGPEYQKNISKYQNNIVARTIGYGADIILGAHPHIVQQFDRFATVGGNLDTGFVVYSLGNFISNQRWRFSDGGLIFNFDITKNVFTDSVYISDISYLPIWVFKGKTEKGKDYIVLPAKEFDNKNKFNYLTEADIDSMRKSYFDTIELLTSKSNYPRIDVIK